METDATGAAAPRLMATCGGNNDKKERVVAIHSNEQDNVR